MEYAQLNEAGTEALQVTTHGNVEWDDTHFCPANALMPDEAALFRVVPLLETPAPTFDPLTQAVMRDGCELVGGQWQYKWLVTDLPADVIAVNQVQVEASRIASLWQAAHDLEYAAISGSAIGLITMGVLQGKPKCLAVQGWIKSIWALYYERKFGPSTDTDFSSVGACPYDVPSLMVELGV